MTVLLYNTSLVDFIWNYIRDTSDIYSIFLLVKISILCFSSLFRLFFFIFDALISAALTREIFLDEKLNFMYSPRRITSSIYIK